jgi:hypothetical protein
MFTQVYEQFSTLIILQYISILVGGSAYPSEKYEFVSWGYEIPNIRKNKKCSKPPIRINCKKPYICTYN